jgi:hypothetical protein
LAVKLSDLWSGEVRIGWQRESCYQEQRSCSYLCWKGLLWGGVPGVGRRVRKSGYTSSNLFHGWTASETELCPFPGKTSREGPWNSASEQLNVEFSLFRLLCSGQCHCIFLYFWSLHGLKQDLFRHRTTQCTWSIWGCGRIYWMLSFWRSSRFWRPPSGIPELCTSASRHKKQYGTGKSNFYNSIPLLSDLFGSTGSETVFWILILENPDSALTITLQA